MERNTLVIGLLLAAVLVPMWYVAAHGEPPAEEIAIDESVTEHRPLEGVVDTPNKLSPSQVGVIVWVALFGLLALLAAVHQFMNRAVRPPEGAVTDGGTNRESGSLPWLSTDQRWVVEYHDASEAIEGLVAMGGLTVLSIVFAALLTGEYLTLARTQYFGLYAAGMFLSLALSTVAYYAWFMPHVEVAEIRGH
ncbi:hypothetical protein NDI56_17680 [Haloarcula sp. S1CR25-12]|uniref:DUF2178 domain-containing protein n=1 Tax=Haloarcula saliterrae TaxID=2950534 RepID=A0ABU2FG73_9EURY|nr:hypothetical protein [Haloarcula sp. S1CR25-12]MDS0261234.1 hypothetical protein [Haloarcula sp. S1CR25-12]